MYRIRLTDFTAKLRSRFNASAIHRRSIACRNSFIYGSEVTTAWKNGLPIVALESTIITHGMPYPENLNTALKVEDAVRKQGVVPATIGIIDGKVHIGLNNEQLEILSKVDPAKTIKCSRKDISFIVSRELNGGTTVSATMLIAYIAGISIMATGGIGGVHRGAELTFDISTDLIELGRTPVAVVCSGIKSILDIDKTLEYLETQGVPVIKIGKTREFPAFYCSKTLDEIKAPYRISDAQEAANILKVQRSLGIGTGILFAVPIPDKYALDPVFIDSMICEALKRANDMHITGKHITPFLLKELNEITRGQSLAANIALIKNNAKVAAEIAVSLYEKSQRTSYTPLASPLSVISKQKPVIIGGAVVDTILQVKEPEISSDGRTHVGKTRRSFGGVGRNVADALIKLGLNNTRLISVVGNDEHGQYIVENLGAGANTIERLSNTNTARLTVILDANGECCFCVSEMESFASISPELVKERKLHLEEASLIVIDGNLPFDTIRYVLDIALHAKVPVWYEPTDIPKAAKIFEAGQQWENVLHFISPNLSELKVVSKFFNIPIAKDMNIKAIRNVSERLNEYIPIVITTLGSQGVLVTRKASQDEPFYDKDGKLITNSPIKSRLYPVVNEKGSNKILNVSGCGDCLTAGIIYGIHQNLDEINCISIGLKAAALSLKSFDAVPQTLTTLFCNKS